MKYKLYEVGGKIRDEQLGLTSKDVDYTVVLEDVHLLPDLAFTLFCKQIEVDGYDIKVRTPDKYTVRAMFPKEHVYSGIADFVLARKEIGYEEGTRNPICKLGTLADDLLRRDFTVNALAKADNGDIVDLFNGQEDLRKGVLRTPTDSYISLNDDPLRIIRAFRFRLTKHFHFSDELMMAIKTFKGDLYKVSKERVFEEFQKMAGSIENFNLIDLLWEIREINSSIYDWIVDDCLYFKPAVRVV